jgi:phage terminase small subunit
MTLPPKQKTPADPDLPAPPKHLAAETRRWFAEVCAAYELEEHQVRLLVLAGEAWDRCVEARIAINTHGLTFVDRFGSPHARPEISIERDSRIGFARLLRELNLEVSPPHEPRQPGRQAGVPLLSNYRNRRR